MSTASQAKHLPALDGVRALAIALVVGYHAYQAQLSDLVTGGRPAQALAFVLGFGWAGVPLFFVLSGFLVAGAIYRQALAGTFALGRFYVDRSLRILPLAYAFLLVWGFFSARLGWNHWTLANFTYSSIALGTGLENAPGHYWSLQIEELFYLVAPFAIVGFVSYDTRPRSAVRLLVLGIAALWTFRIFRLCVLPYDHRPYYAEPYYQVVYNLDYFLAGALVAVWKHVGMLDCLVARVRAERRTLVSVLLLACFFPLALAARPGPLEAGYWVVGVVYPGICVWAAAVVAWFSAQSSDVVGRAFSSTPAKTIAKLSYSIYVWHGLTMSFVDIDYLGTVGQLAFDVVLYGVVGLVSYHAIEVPFLRLRDMLRARPQALAFSLSPSPSSAGRS